MPSLYLLLSIMFLFTAWQPSNDPVARWAAAVGGRDKVAAVTSIYREATLEYGPYRGTLKVWHTSDGEYRKEEQIATYSTIETFDGTTGFVQENSQPPRQMTAAELTLRLSKRFANSNAMFFAFFPERHRGTVTVEQNDTVVLTPEGGVPWRITLAADTGLPKTMTHVEDGRTVVVTFDSYEIVDGIKFEKEIHRSTGEGPGAVIRFTKTIINQPVEASLFKIPPQQSGAAK